MNKNTFRKKWYYLPLILVFWGSFIFFIYIGSLAILYEDDMPFLGVVWIVAAIIVYWLVKRVFYRIMFGDKILPRIFKS